MSPIRMNKLILIVAMGTVTVMFGCSNPNSQSNFDPETGKHISGWLPADHMNAAKADSSGCTQCHGTSLDGGISSVSCTSCHMGGAMAVHPADWNPIFSQHGPYVNSATTGTAACANQYCHGTTLTGVANSGPSCTSCHSLPFDPATVICGACHRIPPAGTQAPNIAGRHAVHTAITGTTQPSCAVCHDGSDGVTGTDAHYNGTVNVSVLATYDAKGVIASYNDAGAAIYTCSNVSCHGGQTTPNWRTGSIDVNAQCTSCHVVGTALATPQYNSAYSGHHDKHVNDVRAACTECHSTSKLAVVHFNDLDTTAMTQAEQTINDSLHYNGSYCSFTCHIDNEHHDSGMTW